MPLTTLMTLLGSFFMIGSWAFIRMRIKASGVPVSQQVHLLQSFFLFLGLFCLVMFIPHLLLNISPENFPIWMAWAYVLGHVLLYIGFIQVLRLTFSMVPRLASKEKYAVLLGWVAITIITLINFKTMVMGTLPAFDYERNVTLFNAAPVVGASIGLFATASLLPAVVLMIRNGIINPPARLRSFLLSIGLIFIMTAGPLHDISRTWQLYMVADVFSIVGILVTATGVAYRLQERISTAPVSASSRA